jgi:hypothetical protein
MFYNARLTELVQYVLEPIQRQQNIILSLTSWLSGLQQIANTFSETVIPDTRFLATINSSKGAFEWYLNQEYNIATYSPYQPIFIGNLIQSSSDLYGYNDTGESEYVPLYFLQDNPPQLLDGTFIFQYSLASAYAPGQITYVVPSLNPLVQIFFQNSDDFVIQAGVPPFNNGVFTNQNVWQAAMYGFNGYQSTGGSEDVDFIVWCPKYLNPGWATPSNTEFDIQIRAYVTKYKMAHTTFGVSYY